MSMDTSAEPRRRFAPSPFILRGLAIVAVILGLLSVASRLAFIYSPRGITNDFTQDYVSARAWMDGLDPYGDTTQLVNRYFGPNSPYDAIDKYGQGGTPHPPTMIIAVRALAGLPYKAARVCWLILMAGAAALALGWFARLIGAKRHTAIVIGIGGLAIPTVQTDLVYGQSNGLLLLLLVVAWWALERDKQRQAGIALGIATAFKIFPFLMLIPLLRMRNYRAAVWTAGVTGGTTVIAGLVMGFSRTISFIRTVSPANVRFWRAAPMNLSLLSVPYRWLTKSVWRPLSASAPALAGVIAAGFLIMLLVAAFRNRARPVGDVFWAAVPFVLLATPTVWETYLVLLIPGAFLLIRSLMEGQRFRYFWPILIAQAVVLIGLFPGLPPALHMSTTAQLLGYSLPMYGLVVLCIGSFVAVRIESSPAVAA